MTAKYAYYDDEVDIAWLQVRPLGNVVSEEVDWGLIDRDRSSGEVVAIEIWGASERIPATILESLPEP